MSGSRVGKRLRVAREVFPLHAFQPATALWRLAEVEVVQSRLRGRGLGLDLGCGDGTLATVLLGGAEEMRWIGLDIDPKDAVAARTIGPYAAVEVASATAIPCTSGSFDLVFSNSALEHMEDLGRVLAEVARVIKPGGGFAFTVPTPDLHHNLLWRRLLSAFGLRRSARRYVAHLDRRLAHRNYLSVEEWGRRLEPLGLEIEEAVPYLSRLELGLWETLANATGGVASLLSGGRHPREIQHAWRIDTPRSRWLGGIAFWLLSPLILLTAIGRPSRHNSGLWVLARKRE